MSPSLPSMKKKAENATIVVKIAENIAGRTSMVPCTAACILFLPFSKWRYIFSLITTPSSTKIPITVIIPKSEITLIVISKNLARINIPAKETGMDNATQNARR